MSDEVNNIRITALFAMWLGLLVVGKMTEVGSGFLEASPRLGFYVMGMSWAPLAVLFTGSYKAKMPAISD